MTSVFLMIIIFSLFTNPNQYTENISLNVEDLMPYIIIMKRKENAKKENKDTPKSSL